jgi:DNA-binding NtrC family response regulator
MRVLNILVIDDDLSLLKNYASFIEKLGHKVTLAYNAVHAIAIIDPIGKAKPKFDGIFLDMRMPEGSGLEFLQGQNERRDMTPCLVHSSENTFCEDNIQFDDLSKIDAIFDFAKFHLKDLDYNYMKNFLESLQK